jgi:hypothetical protein
MLRQRDLKNIGRYVLWNDFANIIYATGFISDIKTNDKSQIIFNLRQTAYENHKIKVMLDKGVFMPADLNEEGGMIKIIGRLQPEIIEVDDKKINNIYIRPIYLGRPSILEIPSEVDFFSKGTEGEKFKTFKPTFTLKELEGSNDKQQKERSKEFSNNIKISGVLYAKRKASDDCVEFRLINGFGRLLNVRIYGKQSQLIYAKLRRWIPLTIEGELQVRQEKISDEQYQTHTYIKARTITPARPGKEIPKGVPDWLQETIDAAEGEQVNPNSITAKKVIEEVQVQNVFSEEGRNGSSFEDVNFNDNGDPV